MPEISLFNSISEPKNPKKYDLVAFLEDIRDGVWYNLVKECRSIEDKAERKAFKDKMPTATFSGLFSYRNDASLDEHSGILAMDIDDLDNVVQVKKQFEKDRYVYAVFISTGGNGLRVLFRIDHNKHNESFQGLVDYIYKEHGQVCDLNSSISKPYIVSFDQYLFYQPEIDEVPIFKRYPKERPVKKLSDFVHTDNDFHRVLKDISQRSISIAEDYLDYIKIGFAFAVQFGENGRDYFHEVSRFSAKYNFKKVDKQYDYCLRDRGQKKANIATFYYFAKMAGVKITSENTKIIVRATKIGRKSGLSKDKIAENLEKFNNITTALSIVSEIYDNQDQSDDEEDSILYQLETFISSNYNLEMNEITGYIEENRKPLSENDLNSIFISAKKTIPTIDFQLMMRLLKSEFIKVYNPFFEFFGSDGVPYILPPMPIKDKHIPSTPIIDKLAETIKNENPAYTSFFLRKWIVSIISSAHKVHSPLLLCLLGGQNTGKTEWFRRLLPSELQAYYAESKLDKEKDDELLMTEKLIIMDDELGGKSKQDNLKLKNITSKQYFSIRRPYGTHNETILRIAVLCGTSNTLNVLSDSTGNRRIIPIEVSDVDKNLYNSIDKKELFLEAFRIYKEGFDWRITQDDVAYLNTNQERYETVIPERELIEKYFKPSEDKGYKLSTTDIKVEIELITHQRLNPKILGEELNKLGYIKKSDRIGTGGKKWCVIRINRNSDKIDDDGQTDLKNSVNF